MTDANVPRGATVELGRVDGRLHVGRGATLRAAGGRLILVTGQAFFDGDATVECDLECKSLTVERSGKLVVSGDLTVHDGLDVSNEVQVRGTMKAEEIDVGGRVRARSVSCKKMRVGGIAQVSELLQADSIEIGGKIEAPGTLQIKELHVGGKASVGGGVITGTTNVGGKFVSSSKLEFGELKVYGFCSLAGGSKGKKIAASGKLEAEGDLDCDQLEISGTASISEDCKTEKAEVRGKLAVGGSLSAKEGLDVSGVAHIGVQFSGGSIKTSGRFTADKAVVTGEAQLSGSSETKQGLKARSVLVGNGTRCTGPLVGDSVEVGASGPSWNWSIFGQRVRVQAHTSQVEDVYASSVVIGPGSRAKGIFAETIELGPGCDVDQVVYVKELRVAEQVKIARPVSKVDKLKVPPL